MTVRLQQLERVVNRLNRFVVDPLFRRAVLVVVLSAAIVVTAYMRPAHAQSVPQQTTEQSGTTQTTGPSNWEVSIGGGPAGVPVYPGAARYRTEPIFLGSLAYRGLAYLGPAGLGSSEIFPPGFHYGPIVDFAGGRNETSDKHLRGLGNISPTLAVGVIGLWRFDEFELIGIVRQAVFHTNYGLVGRVQFDRRIVLMPGKLTLLGGPLADFGDGRYERTWFGISQHQATVSGMPPYNPIGGVADGGFFLSLDYRYSEHILVRTFGEVRWFFGSAARSPIVLNNTQAIFGVGIAYSFDLGDIVPTSLLNRISI